MKCSVFKQLVNAFVNTGERPLVETYFEDADPIHKCAYQFASTSVVPGSCVLDFGCGGGYGSEYLSRFQPQMVTGFDINSKTIATNQRFFGQVPNLAFTSAIESLGQYDLVTSFQVIEHLEIQAVEDWMGLVATKLLKPGGQFLLSTVNKNISSYQLSKPIMPFHNKEYAPRELLALLGRHFNVVRVFGQMTPAHKANIESGTFDYHTHCAYSFKTALLRKTSQYEIVRVVARHVPLFIKAHIFGYTRTRAQSAEHLYFTDEVFVRNAPILLCACCEPHYR